MELKEPMEHKSARMAPHVAKKNHGAQERKSGTAHGVLGGRRPSLVAFLGTANAIHLRVVLGHAVVPDETLDREQHLGNAPRLPVHPARTC